MKTRGIGAGAGGDGVLAPGSMGFEGVDPVGVDGVAGVFEAVGAAEEPPPPPPHALRVITEPSMNSAAHSALWTPRVVLKLIVVVSRCRLRAA